jgi:hypothetical protein
VWEEIGSFDRLTSWFGLGHTLIAYEPKLGATVEFSVEVDGVRQHYGGPITVLEPCRELTFDCNWHDSSWAWPVPMAWTIRLSHAYGGTIVEIYHHGFERLGDSGGVELEGYEQGWDNKHLKALRSIIEH